MRRYEPTGTRSKRAAPSSPRRGGPARGRPRPGGRACPGLRDDVGLPAPRDQLGGGLVGALLVCEMTSGCPTPLPGWPPTRAGARGRPHRGPVGRLGAAARVTGVGRRPRRRSSSRLAAVPRASPHAALGPRTSRWRRPGPRLAIDSRRGSRSRPEDDSRLGANKLRHYGAIWPQEGQRHPRRCIGVVGRMALA